jgi:hypothetical protein
MVWWAYQKRLIQLKDLRVWFATQELVARRCRLKDGQKPHYGIEELRCLVAGRGGEGESVRRLERVGLLTWSSSEIAFAQEPSELRVHDTSSLYEMLARIQNQRRKVPVPRQVLRFIASPWSKRCMIATILGHLFRCLYYHVGECVSGGFCKASWISEVFSVNLRNVKGARKFLARELEFFQFVPTPQSLLNRYGSKVLINLSWSGSAVDKPPRERSELPPPKASSAGELPPPEEHIQPLQEQKHQTTAKGKKLSGVLEARQKEKPTLRHIAPEDLRDTTRLLTLFEEAQGQGFIGGSESERLIFVATAERARVRAIDNPPGLFAELIRRRLWHFVTQDDEDRARERLREHFYGGKGQGRTEVVRYAPSGFSKDALFVSDVQARLQRRGFMGDTFSLVSRELPDWTRGRWEKALTELQEATRKRDEEGVPSPNHVKVAFPLVGSELDLVW